MATLPAKPFAETTETDVTVPEVVAESVSNRWVTGSAYTGTIAPSPALLKARRVVTKFPSRPAFIQEIVRGVPEPAI